VRFERILKRVGTTPALLEELEKHPTECEVQACLIKLADFVTVNSSCIEGCVDQIVGWAIEKNLIDQSRVTRVSNS
jgi:hypothetical protein